MYDAILNQITGFETLEDWKGQCVAKVKDALQTNDTAGLVGGFVTRLGKVLPDLPNTPIDQLAGITYNACETYCGFDKLPTVFNFEDFSSGATNYLLPWLALTAQLPFETGENEILANLMSFCYAVGSPMLITYSLATTILNQHWLRAKFRKLEASDRPLHQTSKNARIFLQESQQLPLRLSQEDGSLASLIVLPENSDWWEKLTNNVLLTRRGVTLSLVAQILVAVLSWLLTVISAFITQLGNASAALALASGSLWVWLIPVIWGWIAVGTQREYGTITRALKRDMANIVDRQPPSQPAGSPPDPPADPGVRRDTVSDGFVDNPSAAIAALRQENQRRQILGNTGGSSTANPRRPSQPAASGVQIVLERQKAFKIADERRLMRPLTRSPTAYGFFHLEPSHSKFGVPNCLGFSVAGDEKQEGPAFNYARIFTWCNMANRLHDALEMTDHNMEQRLDIDKRPVPRDLRFRQRDLKGDVLALSRYCGLAEDTDGSTGQAIEPQQIDEYPHWNDLDAAFYQRIVIAVLVAFWVQWGTTSAAVVIAYLTEVKGFGCRSGGYLLYGALATGAFFFLFVSSIFSHAAMLRHQVLQIDETEHHDERDPKSVRDSSETHSFMPRPVITSNQSFDLAHSVLRVCAVTTRVFGRILAVSNTVWILLSSLWEIVGFYSNCWCDTTFISKGTGGWVLLFVDVAETAQSAAPSWAGGVFLSAFVGATTCGGFWLYCRGNRA
jgi:hypothetical protein